MKECHIFKET
uniref:Uncharacterized protein n=1 Tax=Anguilla anguilla TaxID=7936 RepID=A0A0E9QTL1_ANGAN